MLRALNERAALYALLRHGPMSRVELDHAIGLSKPAAAELLRRLEDAGLVRRDGFQTVRGPGPQAQLWTVSVEAGHAAGVDISANTVNVAVAHLGGVVVGEAKLSTRGVDPVMAVTSAVQEAARVSGLQLADIVHTVAGITGSVDPVTGFLEYAVHMPRWHGFDVQRRLTETLGHPVTVENDVNLVTVDEVAGGQGRGHRNVVLLWMSRGVAIASIVDGRLVRGSRGGAGEIDRIRIDGTEIRDLLSNRAVLNLARKHDVSGVSIGAAVRRGMTTSATFAAELTERVVAALTGPVALLDPELVILAGDVAIAADKELVRSVADRLHELLAHRPEVAIASGSANSVRQGAVHAAVGAAREKVLGRGVGETTDLQSWLVPQIHSDKEN